MPAVYKEISDSDIDQMALNSQLSFGGELTHATNWLRSPVRTTDLRGYYVDGQLVAQMEIHPFQVMTGRGTLGCGGLAAVATPPQHRRQGYVAQMLRAGCDEMRERGAPLIMLGPFKESFYGRYGWATFGERRVYTGSPEKFAPFRRRHGQFTPAGTEQIGELDAIYKEALRGRFGPLARTEARWKMNVLTNEYWQQRHHAFIWRDETGKGRAYLVYRVREKGEKQVLGCRDIVALDPEARAQLFSFLASHQDQVDEISFAAPTDAPVQLLFPDPLECTVEQSYMLRLLDLPVVLEAYPFPRDVRGRLTISVSDDWLPQNRGVFALEVSGGAAQVTRLPDDAEAGIRCDQRVLVQLISRYVRPRTAAAFGLLEAPDRDALALADQLFAGLAPFLSDWF
jgi:predicted acetyltransferase